MLRNIAYGGLALVSGAVTGIVVSSWATPRSPPPQPSEIVHIATVAQPAMTLRSTPAHTASDASKCGPWDVSDVAMEAALDEMVRRGWTPPTQAEAIAAFQPPSGRGAHPVEPDTAVPVRYPSPPAPSASPEPGAASSAPFPVGQIELPPVELNAPEFASPATPVAPPPPVEPPAPAVAPPASLSSQTPLITSEAPAQDPH